MRRGEIRWYTFRAPDERRPVLILSRDEVIDQLNELIVAPLTRTVAGIVDGGRAQSRRRNARGVCGQLRPHLSGPALSSGSCPSFIAGSTLVRGALSSRGGLRFRESRLTGLRARSGILINHWKVNDAVGQTAGLPQPCQREVASPEVRRLRKA
jgi:hypothetical protein